MLIPGTGLDAGNSLERLSGPAVGRADRSKGAMRMANV
jgi:hypothetical protein